MFVGTATVVFTGSGPITAFAVEFVDTGANVVLDINAVVGIAPTGFCNV